MNTTPAIPTSRERRPGAALELLPIGIGDAFSVKHASTCLALRASGRWILVDCPHPIRKLVNEASITAGIALDIEQIDAVVLTHLHADHASGIEGFGFWSRYMLGRRARLVAHPDVSRRLWGGHLAAGMEWTKGSDGKVHRSCFEDFFDLGALDEARPVTIGPFTIECRRTIHVIPTTALRISACGRTLGYSADTEFDPTLVEWLALADLVIHETGPGIHTPLASLAELPAALRKKMRLVHFADRDVLLDGPIEPLEEGRLVTV